MRRKLGTSDYEIGSVCWELELLNEHQRMVTLREDTEITGPMNRTLLKKYPFRRFKTERGRVILGGPRSDLLPVFVTLVTRLPDFDPNTTGGS